MLDSLSRNISSPTRSRSFQLDRTECICDCYKHGFHPDFLGLNIRLDDVKISKWWTDRRVLSSTALERQINLKQLISSDGSTMSGIAKMTLSVFLAYSIFYLYGGSWAKGGWKRENIVFFSDGNGIPLRPFLKVPPPTKASDQDQPQDGGNFHRYPEFLELGIMLLEIHFGQSLESMLGRNIVSLDEYFAAAWEVYLTKKLDIISRGLRSAVERCLKADFEMGLDNEEPDDDELRSKIFDNVVQPLEEELDRAFQEFISIDALDDEASTKIRLPLKSAILGPLLGAGQDNQRPRPTGPMNPGKLGVPESLPRITIRSWRDRSCSPSKGPQSFELFSNESKTIEPRPDR